MTSVYYSFVHTPDHDKEYYRSLVEHRLQPKFLYSTPHIASVYEQILGDPTTAPKYRRNNEYGSFLFAFLKKNLPEIQQHSPLGFVSLGVGAGDIEESFLNHHIDHHLYNHIFIDYSKYFLEKVTTRLSATFPQADLTAIHADFVDGDKKQLSSCLKNLPKKQKVFLLMGEIFGKHHPTATLLKILSLLQVGDYLVFDLNIFPSDPSVWLGMVKNQILKFSHQEYYYERIAALGFDKETTHLEFQLQDEEYNSFWNVYTRLLTFSAPQPVQVGNSLFTLYPGDTFSMTKYHYFKEQHVLEFFKKFPVQVVQFHAPLVKQPHSSLRWCILQKNHA